MATKTVSQLTEKTELVGSDVLLVEDSTTTYKVTRDNLVKGLATETGVETALAGKSDTGHKHTVADVTDLQTTLNGLALAVKTEVGTALAGKSDTGHKHAIADVTDLQTTLNGLATKTELNNGLLSKVGSGDLAKVATSGSYNDLADKPSATDGEDGVGISKIEQTTTSTEDGGSNVITVTLTDTTTSTFTVKNGSKGSKGDTGEQGPKGDNGANGTFDATTEFADLKTTSKTIIGAINELFDLIEGLKTAQANVEPEVQEPEPTTGGETGDGGEQTQE